MLPLAEPLADELSPVPVEPIPPEPMLPEPALLPIPPAVDPLPDPPDPPLPDDCADAEAAKLIAAMAIKAVLKFFIQLFSG